MMFIVCIFLSLLSYGTTNAMERSEHNTLPQKPVPGLYRCTKDGTFEKIPSHMYDMADDRRTGVQDEPIKNNVWVNVINCAKPLAAGNIGTMLIANEFACWEAWLFYGALFGMVCFAEKKILENESLQNQTKQYEKNKKYSLILFSLGFLRAACCRINK